MLCLEIWACILVSNVDVYIIPFLFTHADMGGRGNVITRESCHIMHNYMCKNMYKYYIQIQCTCIVTNMNMHTYIPPPPPHTHTCTHIHTPHTHTHTHTCIRIQLQCDLERANDQISTLNSRVEALQRERMQAYDEREDSVSKLYFENMKRKSIEKEVHVCMCGMCVCVCVSVCVCVCV